MSLSPVKPLWLLLSLSTLLLPACASPTTELTKASDTAAAIGHVRPSRSDTCKTQEQIAEQSSKIDTIITGREVVYKADCKKNTPKGEV